MKGDRLKILKNKIYIIILFYLFIIIPIYSANITSISNVQIIPSNPSPGDTVEVRWDYYVDSEYNNPHSLVVVSDQNTLRPANTAGQWVMIGNGCTTPSDPSTAQVTGGCDMGTNLSPAGTHSSTESGTYTFTLPTDLIPGYTYYIIVGMKDYNVYMNPSVDVSAQNYVAFTIPLPPPTIELTKIAEGSAATQGGLVLYTIHYYIANTNNVVITDDVPPEITFIEAYDGGVESGGTITWNLGSVTSPVRGSVSWLGQVKATVPDGSVISNYAYGNSDELSNIQSNNATVTIGPSLSIEKIAEPTSVDVGDTVTYTLSYTNSGYALSEYIDFDSSADLSDWTIEVSGATWQVTGGYLEGNGPAGQWGKIIKNTPSLHDAMYITDVYVPSSNPSGDGVFIFNFIDQDNNYHARIQTDMNQVCFDKVVASTWSSVQCVTPSGFSLQNDRWYTLKVQVDGSNIKIKVWPKGDPEPAGWNINLTDTSHSTAGRPGYQDNEGEDRFDNLKIFTPSPASNVIIYDTVPNCMTYLGCSGGTSCSENSGFVTWNLGNLGNDYGTVLFWVRAESCASGTVVHNTGCIDSTEEPPAVCSNDAEVQVGPQATDTFTPTFTSTFTPTFTPTFTLTLTFTYTLTDTPTFTPTYTSTDTPTETYTGTPLPTNTFTQTYTFTFTPTLTYTSTDTPTETYTGTPLPTDTFTQTYTFTLTFTNTHTPTFTNTFTPTFTFTSTYTFTNTPTPEPANIKIELNVIDVSARAGGYAEVKVLVKNIGGSTARNVKVWDTVPLKTTFDKDYEDNTNWQLLDNVFVRNIGDIKVGETKIIYFYVKLDDNVQTGEIITITKMTASYTDDMTPSVLKYALSNDGYISIGEIQIYPNPFNPDTAKDGVLKFRNVPTGAIISIYTLSGELVKAIPAKKSCEFWDGKNLYKIDVSPGIYYYLIRWNNGKDQVKGKIFVIR